MNSYFDHGTNGFYSPAHHPSAAEAHQVAYRSFTQGLVPLMPSSSAYQGSRSSSAAASSDSANYSETSKIYDSPTVNGQPIAFKSECNSAKEANGFKPPERMTPPSWNGPLRPSTSTSVTSESLRGFDSSRSVSDAWSACCQGSSSTVGGPANAFYPWMAAIPHPQPRPDAGTYLSDDHRASGPYSDAYSSRLILGDTSNYHPGGLPQGATSSGEWRVLYLCRA